MGDFYVFFNAWPAPLPYGLGLFADGGSLAGGYGRLRLQGECDGRGLTRARKGWAHGGGDGGAGGHAHRGDATAGCARPQRGARKRRAVPDDATTRARPDCSRRRRNRAARPKRAQRRRRTDARPDDDDGDDDDQRASASPQPPTPMCLQALTPSHRQPARPPAPFPRPEALPDAARCRRFCRP